MTKDTYVFVWDFDNTLFYNPSDDFSDEYLNLDIDKKVFPVHFYITSNEFRHIKNVSFDILMTGRGEYQSNSVKTILKDFNFRQYIFFRKNKEEYPQFNKAISVEKYMEDYKKWKCSEVALLNLKYNNKIIVVDDNVDIISFCKLNNIFFVHFDLKKILKK